MRVGHNKDGSLNRQALACGYREEATTQAGHDVALWQEHGAYHVRVNDAETRAILRWDVHHRLTLARKQYRHYVRNL